MPVEHRVERQGGTPTTAREAGTPPRLVRSNPLFDGDNYQTLHQGFGDGDDAGAFKVSAKTLARKPFIDAPGGIAGTGASKRRTSPPLRMTATHPGQA